MRFADPGGPSGMTFSARSTKPSSCRLSICSRLMEGWKAQSNWSRVFTAGNREERMAVWSRLLWRSTIWAFRRCSMASAAVIASLSASSAPGNLSE